MLNNYFLNCHLCLAIKNLIIFYSLTFYSLIHSFLSKDDKKVISDISKDEDK